MCSGNVLWLKSCGRIMAQTMIPTATASGMSVLGKPAESQPGWMHTLQLQHTRTARHCCDSLESDICPSAARPSGT